MRGKSLLLFLVLMISTRVGAAGDAPSTPTIKNLMDRLQANVGSGWTVVYDAKFGVISISRNELTEVSYVVLNAAGSTERNACEGDGKKEHFIFSVSVEPLMPPAEYDRVKHENDLVEERRFDLEKELRKSGVNFWMPNPDGRISVHSNNSQVETEIEEYNGLNKKFVRLPDGYFRDVSASWTNSGGASEVADSPKVQRECEEVSNRFIKVFTQYSTAP